MRINTTLKYNFKANISVPRVMKSNGQEAYLLYPRLTDVSVNIVSSRGGSTMFTREAVEFGARLSAVRNPDGELLFVEDTALGPLEYSMHVWSVLPVVDVYGTITGYRSVLKQPQPELTDIKDEEVG